MQSTITMAEKTLAEVIRTSTVAVHSGRYAYLKLPAASRLSSEGHFLVARDAEEVTVVTEEKHVASLKPEKEVKWFTLMEIRVTLPFLAKGFIAAISKAIAEKGLNILVVSTFSKDYILVREETSEQAIEALKKLGFPVIRSPS